MKVSLNLYQNKSYNYKPSSLSFKGNLYACTDVDTCELKKISKRDYEQEVERQKNGDFRTCIVDAEKDTIKFADSKKTYISQLSDFYEEDNDEYSDAYIEKHGYPDNGILYEDDEEGDFVYVGEDPIDTSIGELICENSTQFTAFSDDFEERLEVFRQSEHYNRSLERKEVLEKLSKLPGTVMEALSDDFLCKMLQFSTPDCDFLKNFEEYLLEEFTPEELYTITSDPQQMDLLLYCMTDAYDEEKAEKAIEYLHEQTEL